LTVREICETYELKQTELAVKFGIPLRSVQNWYNDVRTPPDYVLNMIVTILEYEKNGG
jgi:DNA-binding transcriptional regulator YiaG